MTADRPDRLTYDAAGITCRTCGDAGCPECAEADGQAVAVAEAVLERMGNVTVEQLGELEAALKAMAADMGIDYEPVKLALERALAARARPVASYEPVECPTCNAEAARCPSPGTATWGTAGFTWEGPTGTLVYRHRCARRWQQARHERRHRGRNGS